ncbi:hypothetical protein [Kordiimonas sp.]|uniref:hypothetical protein n=1 Tax=Kordiimonas sp. TaxID=1970157 RepID=UPI003A91EF5C
MAKKRSRRVPVAVKYSERPKVFFVRGRRKAGQLMQFTTTKNVTREKMAGRTVVHAKYRGAMTWFVERKAYVKFDEIDEAGLFRGAGELKTFKRSPCHNGTVRMIYEANEFAEGN